MRSLGNKLDEIRHNASLITPSPDIIILTETLIVDNTLDSELGLTVFVQEDRLIAVKKDIQSPFPITNRLTLTFQKPLTLSIMIGS